MSTRYLTFVIDVTGSMAVEIRILNKLLNRLLMFVSLTGVYDYVSVISYGDYDRANPVSNTGWKKLTQIESLLRFTRELVPGGGGGNPEAFKTAMWELYTQISNDPNMTSENSRVNVVHITDAPMHTFANLDREGQKELLTLAKNFELTTLTKNIEAQAIIKYYGLVKVMDPYYTYLASHTMGLVAVYEQNEVSICEKMSRLMESLIFNDVEFTGMINTNQVTGGERQLPGCILTVVKVMVDPLLESRFKEALAKLTTDEKSYDDMYQTLTHTIERDLMAVIEHDMIGRVYRKLVSRRGTKRDQLIDLTNKAGANLPPKDQLKFATWLRASYDATSEINDELKSLVDTQGVTGVYRYNGGTTVTTAEILACTRTCLPSEQEQAMKLLLGFEFDELKCENYTLSSNELPANLSNERLFALIGHPVASGTLLSLRPRAILALLALRSGCILSERALDFLISVKGKWLSFALSPDKTQFMVAENFSECFLNFLRPLCVKFPQLFTPDETRRVEVFLSINRLMRLPDQELEIKVEERRCLDRQIHAPAEYFKKCPECKFQRPLSLFDEKGICGYCLTYFGKNRTPYSQTPEYHRDMLASMYMQVRCGKCRSMYERDIRTTNMGNNQCHYCIHKLPNPRKECVKCHIFHLSHDPLPNGICSPCALGMKSILRYETRNVTLRNFLDVGEFLQIYRKFGIRTDKVLPSNLFQAVTSVTLSEGVDLARPDTQTVEDWDRVMVMAEGDSMVLAIAKGQGKTVCDLCCQPKKLFPMCGRTNCHSRMCDECAIAWYDVQPGTIINFRHAFCPCCTRVPANSVLRRLGVPSMFMKLAGFSPKSNIYYAWCQTCLEIFEHSEKTCHAAAPTLTNAVCEGCDHVTQAKLRAMVEDEKFMETCPKCPKCLTPTVKSHGCNHITCSCGQHWCYRCGKGFDTAAQTYGHMFASYGTYFDDGDDFRNDDH